MAEPDLNRNQELPASEPVANVTLTSGLSDLQLAQRCAMGKAQQSILLQQVAALRRAGQTAQTAAARPGSRSGAQQSVASGVDQEA